MANTYTDLLKLRKPASGDTSWDDEVNENTEIIETVLDGLLGDNCVVSGLAPTDGGILDVNYAIGIVRIAGVLYPVAASSETCTDDDLNWLYVDSAGVMQINVTPPTGVYVPIAFIDCSSNDIDRIGDLRNMVSVLPDSKINLIKNPFEVWSNSTLENVGSDLVLNGGFDSDTANWTGTNATLASIAGGQAGNCLQITRTGAGLQVAFQVTPVLTKGKLYAVVAYVKSGTSGNEAFQLRAIGTGVVGTLSGTSTGSWVAHTLVFEADRDNTHELDLIKNTATVGTMLHDTVTIYEVTPGCVAADTKGPDGWEKTTSASVKLYKEYRNASVPVGVHTELKIVNTSGSDCHISLTQGIDNDDINYLAEHEGRIMTTAITVRGQSAASKVAIGTWEDGFQQLDINTGSGEEWLEGSRTIGTGLSAFRSLTIKVATGETVYVSLPMDIFGSSIGEGNYQPSQDKDINLEENIILEDGTSWPTTADHLINLEVQSNGKIPKGIKGIFVKYWVRDSNSSGAAAVLVFGADVSVFEEVRMDIGTGGLAMANNKIFNSNAFIRCNSDGNIESEITASGGASETLDISLNVYRVLL